MIKRTITKGQTTKKQKKNTHKTKDRVTGTQLKIEGKLSCSTIICLLHLYIIIKLFHILTLFSQKCH
jgi:hypothetical protein